MSKASAEVSATRHTKGPWSAGERTSFHDWHFYPVFAPLGEEPFANIESRIATAQQVEDARLIASAPELLEALKAMQKAYEQLMPGLAHIAVQDYANINEAPILAAKAIAKAEGRSQ